MAYASTNLVGTSFPQQTLGGSYNTGSTYTTGSSFPTTTTGSTYTTGSSFPTTSFAASSPTSRVVTSPTSLGVTSPTSRVVTSPKSTRAAPATTAFGTTSFPATTVGSPVGRSYPTTSFPATTMPVTMKAASPITSSFPITSAPLTRSVAPVTLASFESRPLGEDRIIRAQAVYKTDFVEQQVEERSALTGDEPSVFENVPVAPPDAILSLASRFKEDKFPRKANLGIGAYRTEEGKPWPLPSVLAAQLAVCQDPKEDKEYVPIDGKPEHKKPVQQLIFTDAAIADGAIATTQALSGTGSLAIIGQFLCGMLNCNTIHVPQPTWGNHHAIFKRSGLACKNYTYYHPESRGFDYSGMMDALMAMPAGDAILLHACAQNPTGVDPTNEQWEVIVDTIRARGLIPILDNAYQGYASGDLEKDGFAMRLFEQRGLEYFIAQSFAKNFGLYGERIGYIHVRTESKQTAAAVLSQLKILIRQAYSSPPRHGAAIVNKVLTTPKLKEQWLNELNFMSQRILQMRDALRRAIESRYTPGTWNHITDQIGMFSYTGLNLEQVKRMVEEFHIYMTNDGRISIAGLNPGNVDYVADCIDIVARM